MQKWLNHGLPSSRGARRDSRRRSASRDSNRSRNSRGGSSPSPRRPSGSSRVAGGGEKKVSTQAVAAAIEYRPSGAVDAAAGAKRPLTVTLEQKSRTRQPVAGSPKRLRPRVRQRTVAAKRQEENVSEATHASLPECQRLWCPFLAAAPVAVDRGSAQEAADAAGAATGSATGTAENSM